VQNGLRHSHVAEGQVRPGCCRAARSGRVPDSRSICRSHCTTSTRSWQCRHSSDRRCRRGGHSHTADIECARCQDSGCTARFRYSRRICPSRSPFSVARHTPAANRRTHSGPVSHSRDQPISRFHPTPKARLARTKAHWDFPPIKQSEEGRLVIRNKNDLRG
jgi:hypothetical protein